MSLLIVCVLFLVESVDKRLERSAKLVKTGNKTYAEIVEVLKKVKSVLDSGKPASAAAKEAAKATGYPKGEIYKMIME